MNRDDICKESSKYIDAKEKFRISYARKLYKKGASADDILKIGVIRSKMDPLYVEFSEGK